MRRDVFPLGEWLPDRPVLGNPGLLVADGVWPVAQGYAPLGQFAPAIGGTLAGDCLGAASARSVAGSTFTIAGTASHLYRYSTAGWASVGSGYSASAGVGWQFAQWEDLILATNGSDAVQKLDMDAAMPGFSALGGTPPTAEMIAIVRDFAVLGRTAGNPLQMQWSGIRNVESWTPGTDQSDTQIMRTGGDIQGITGGEFGIVLQERRVSRMSYVGSPLVFQFDELSDNIGCIARGSVARVGPLTFFMSQQGFAVCDGNSVRPIGDEKVNRTLQAEISRNFFSAMSAVVDPQNSLIVWAIPNATVSTKLYIYNYALDRWSTATQPCQRLFIGLSEGVTLEGLSAAYPDLDAVPASLDDDLWKGGVPRILLIDNQRRLGGLSGNAMAAMFETAALPLAGGRRARMRRARLLADVDENVTVEVAGAPRRGCALSRQTFNTMNRFGDVPIRFACQYPQFTFRIAANTDWREATGFEIEHQEAGL